MSHVPIHYLIIAEPKINEAASIEELALLMKQAKEEGSHKPIFFIEPVHQKQVEYLWPMKLFPTF